MSAPVDVLEVMRRCANVSTCNAQRHGGPTLKKHADEVSEACAAVAELIEAAERARNCERFDSDVDSWVTYSLRFRESRDRLSSALARVKGA